MHRRDKAPALSVILPTANDFSGIRLTVRALAAQTARGRIELVIVVPHGRSRIIESEVRGFARVTIVNAGPVVTSNKSRAAGIRAATAPIIALAEDHSFPDPDWAEILIAAHESNYAVVGPVLRNANPRSALSWANLLLEYSPWLEGTPRGEMVDLPGHNSSYKRDLLLEYGDRLDAMFEVEAVIQRDLCAKGHRMLLEPGAKTSHLNFSRLAPSVYLRFNAGRSFAGHRIIGWPLMKRAVYAVASPLIPAVRFLRIFHFLRGSAQYRPLLPRVIPLLVVALLADGFGECVGYVTGPGGAARKLGTIEFDRIRFLDASDRDELSSRMAELDAPASESGALAV